MKIKKVKRRGKKRKTKKIIYKKNAARDKQHNKSEKIRKYGKIKIKNK